METILARRLHGVRAADAGTDELRDAAPALGVQDRRSRDHRPGARSNEGLFRPFALNVPPGTVFSAERPAPTGWYYEGAAYATELVWKALAPVVPERLGPAGYAASAARTSSGTDEAGELFVLAEPKVAAGGQRARRRRNRR